MTADTCAAPGALVCFSHLRWDFVYQRPQHLMSRFAASRRVFFFEEYIPCDHHLPYFELHPFAGTSVLSVRPRVPHWWDEAARDGALRDMLDTLLSVHGGGRPTLWFYTPMMFGIAAHIDAAAVVYDCMDELANFAFAPERLREHERALLDRADVVFTGGYSLFEAKRRLHRNIHPFPSAVDFAHFAASRSPAAAPLADQAGIGRPRLGFCGVIDERMDLALLDAVAAARPAWQFVMIGPVVKIDPACLPRRPNLHFLGGRAYDDLPRYMAGWDAALLPFALNDATRFISPTKVPEYLAAGLPVVSTPITDVVRHYGGLAGVRLAGDPAAFIAACEAAIALQADPDAWRPAADALLGGISWDRTFHRMAALLEAAEADRRAATMVAPFDLQPISVSQ